MVVEGERSPLCIAMHRNVLFDRWRTSFYVMAIMEWVHRDPERNRLVINKVQNTFIKSCFNHYKSISAILQISLGKYERVIGNTNPLPVETPIVCSQMKEE